MGQKVNPISLRLGIIRTWDSKWYANQRDVPLFVKEDYQIRHFLESFYKSADISHIEILRSSQKKTGTQPSDITVYINAARSSAILSAPYIVNKKETGLTMQAAAQAKLEKITGRKIQINARSVVLPERVAQIVASRIARDLENKVTFRRAQRQAQQKAMKCGAKGIKTLVSGRLGGAEMARSEGYSVGRVPLHTFRADVDYATAEALTEYGILGVKVWIFQGEVLPGMKREELIPVPKQRSSAGEYRGNRPNRDNRNNNRNNDNSNRGDGASNRGPANGGSGNKANSGSQPSRNSRPKPSKPVTPAIKLPKEGEK
jgi:small subunit ribosomal protein S3